MICRAIAKSNCFHERGHKASCKFSNNAYMICLGIVEIFASQIPNIHKLSWLSTIAATMSFSYASIGIGLSIATLVSGNIQSLTILSIIIMVQNILMCVYILLNVSQTK